VPVFLVLFQQFLNNINYAFIGRLSQTITLGVIGCGMAQSGMVFVTEIYHFLGLEGSIIIGNDLFRTAKYGQYVGF